MVASRSTIRSHRRRVDSCRTHRRLEHAHARPPRRSVRTERTRLFFSGQISQHMETSRVADWLGGGALLLTAVSWGLLVSLLEADAAPSLPP
jgi:hypothetical protein